MRYAMHYFWKCLGPQFLICFYYPVNIYNVGGFARHQHYWAQEENKEKLNIAFQYLKTEHVDFFLAENYFRHFPD